MTGLGTSIMLESEAKGILIGEDKGVILSAEVFKAIRAGETDNAIIAKLCGCTKEMADRIRKGFEI